MFLQGPRVFAAVDIYTGRVLWKKPIETAIDQLINQFINQIQCILPLALIYGEINLMQYIATQIEDTAAKNTVC